MIRKFVASLFLSASFALVFPAAIFAAGPTVVVTSAGGQTYAKGGEAGQGDYIKYAAEVRGSAAGGSLSVYLVRSNDADWWRQPTFFLGSGKGYTPRAPITIAGGVQADSTSGLNGQYYIYAVWSGEDGAEAHAFSAAPITVAPYEPTVKVIGKPKLLKVGTTFVAKVTLKVATEHDIIVPFNNEVLAFATSTVPEGPLANLLLLDPHNVPSTKVSPGLKKSADGALASGYILRAGKSAKFTYEQKVGARQSDETYGAVFGATYYAFPWAFWYYPAGAVAPMDSGTVWLNEPRSFSNGVTLK